MGVPGTLDAPRRRVTGMLFFSAGRRGVRRLQPQEMGGK
jgi:hypothetical protein